MNLNCRLITYRGRALSINSLLNSNINVTLKDDKVARFNSDFSENFREVFNFYKDNYKTKKVPITTVYGVLFSLALGDEYTAEKNNTAFMSDYLNNMLLDIVTGNIGKYTDEQLNLYRDFERIFSGDYFEFEDDEDRNAKVTTDQKTATSLNKIVVEDKNVKTPTPTEYVEVKTINDVIRNVRQQSEGLSNLFGKFQHGLMFKSNDGTLNLVMEYNVFAKKLIGYSMFNHSDEMLNNIAQRLKINNNIKDKDFEKDLKLIFDNLSHIYLNTDATLTDKERKELVKDVNNKLEKIYELLVKHNISFESILREIYHVYKFNNKKYLSKDLIKDYNTLLIYKVTYDLFEKTINIVDDVILQILENTEETDGIKALNKNKPEIIDRVKERLTEEFNKMYLLSNDKDVVKNIEQINSYINIIVDGVFSIFKNAYEGKSASAILNSLELYKNSNDYAAYKFELFKRLSDSISKVLSNYFKVDFEVQLVSNSENYIGEILTNTEQEDTQDEDIDEYDNKDDDKGNDEEIIRESIKITPILEFALEPIYALLKLKGKMNEKIDIFAELGSFIKTQIDKGIPALYVDEVKEDGVVVYKLSKLKLTDNLSNIVSNIDSSVVKENNEKVVDVNNIIQKTLLIMFSPSEIKDIKTHQDVENILMKKIGAARYNRDYVIPMRTRVNSVIPINNITNDNGFYQITGVVDDKPGRFHRFNIQRPTASKLVKNLKKLIYVKAPDDSAFISIYDLTHNDKYIQDSNTKSYHPTIKILDAAVVYPMNYHVHGYGGKVGNDSKYFEVSTAINTKVLNLTDYIFTTLFYLYKRNNEGKVEIRVDNRDNITRDHYIIRAYNYGRVDDQIRALELDYTEILLNFKEAVDQFMSKNITNVEDIQDILDNKFFEFSYMIYLDFMNLESTNLSSLLERISKKTDFNFNDFLTFSKSLARDVSKLFKNMGLYDDAVVNELKGILNSEASVKAQHKEFLNSQFLNRTRNYFGTLNLTRISKNKESDSNLTYIKIGFVPSSGQNEKDNKPEGSIYVSIVDLFIDSLIKENVFAMSKGKIYSSSAVVGEQGFNFPTNALTNAILQYANNPELIESKNNYLSHLYGLGKKLGYEGIIANYIREPGNINIKGGPTVYMFSNVTLLFSNSDLFTFNPTVKNTFLTLSMGNLNAPYNSLMSAMGYEKSISLIKLALLDAFNTIKRQVEINKETMTDSDYNTLASKIDEAFSKLFLIPDDYFFHLVSPNKKSDNKSENQNKEPDYNELAKKYLQILLNPIKFVLDVENNKDYYEKKLLLENQKYELEARQNEYNRIIKTLEEQVFGYTENGNKKTLFDNAFLDRYMLFYTVVIALHEELNARRLFNKYKETGMMPDTLLKKNKDNALFIQDDTLFVLKSVLPEGLIKSLEQSGILKELIEFLKSHDNNDLSFNEFKEKFFGVFKLDSKVYKNLMKSVNDYYSNSVESEEITNTLSIIDDLKKRIEHVKNKYGDEDKDYLDEYKQLYKDVRNLLGSVVFRRMPTTQIYKYGLLDDKQNTKDVYSRRMIGVEYTIPFVHKDYLDRYFQYGDIDGNGLLGINRNPFGDDILKELDKMESLLDVYKELSKYLLHFANNTLQKISLIYTLGLATELSLVKEEAGDMSKRITSLTSSGIEFTVNPYIIESDLNFTRAIGAIINTSKRISVMVVDDLKIDLSKTELMKRLEEITGDESVLEPYKEGNHTDAHCLVSPHLWYYAAKQYNYATDETLEVMKFINAYDIIYKDVKDGKRSYLDLVKLINEFIDYKDKVYVRASGKNFIPIIKMQYAGPEYYGKDVHTTNNHKYTWLPIHPLLKVSTKLSEIEIENGENLKEIQKFERLVSEDKVLKFEHDVYSFMLDKGVMYVTSGIKISKPVRIEGGKNEKINNIYTYEIVKNDKTGQEEIVVSLDRNSAEKSIVVNIHPSFLKLNTKNSDVIKVYKPLNPKTSVLVINNSNIATILNRVFKKSIQETTRYLVKNGPKERLPVKANLANELLYLPSVKSSKMTSKENRLSPGSSFILYPGSRNIIPAIKNVQGKSNEKEDPAKYLNAVKSDYEFFNDIKRTILTNSDHDYDFNFKLQSRTYILEIALTEDDYNAIMNNKNVKLKFDYGFLEFEILGYEDDERFAKITNIKDKNLLGEYKQVKVVTLKVEINTFLSNTGLKEKVKEVIEGLDKNSEQYKELNEKYKELDKRGVLVFKDSIIIEGEKDMKSIDIDLYESLEPLMIKQDINKLEDKVSFERLEFSFSPMFYYLLFLKHKDGKIIGTISRLNEMLKDETFVKENLNYLALVSYRVPLQTGGSYVISIPERFTGLTMAMSGNALNNVRTGGDFDNDSLSVHFKAYDLVLTYKVGGEEFRDIIYAKDMNNFEDINLILQKIKYLEDKKIPYTIDVKPSGREIINHSSGHVLTNINELSDLIISIYRKGLNISNYFSGVVNLQLTDVIKELYNLGVGNKMFMDSFTQTKDNANTSSITKTIGFLVYFQQLLNYKSIPGNDLSFLLSQFSTDDIDAKVLITRDGFLVLDSDSIDKVLMQEITFSVDAVKDQSGVMIINMMRGPLLNSLGILVEVLDKYFKSKGADKESLKDKPTMSALSLLYPLEVIFTVYRDKNGLVNKNFVIDYNLRRLSRELESIAFQHNKNKKENLSEYSLLESLIEINKILNKVIDGKDISVLDKEYKISDAKTMAQFLKNIKDLMEVVMYKRYEIKSNNLYFKLKDGNTITMSAEEFGDLMHLLSHVVSILDGLTKSDFKTLFEYEVVKSSKNAKKFKTDLSTVFTLSNSYSLYLLGEYLFNLSNKVSKVLNFRRIIQVNPRVIESSIEMLTKFKDKAQDIYYNDGIGAESYRHSDRNYNPFMNIELYIKKGFRKSLLIDELLFNIADAYLLRNLSEEVVKDLVKEYYFDAERYGTTGDDRGSEIKTENEGNRELKKDLVRGSFFFMEDTFLYSSSSRLNAAIDLLSKYKNVTKLSKSEEDVKNAHVLFSNEKVKNFIVTVIEKAAPELANKIKSGKSEDVVGKEIDDLFESNLANFIFLLGYNNPDGNKSFFYSFFAGSYSKSMMKHEKVYFKTSANLARFIMLLKDIFTKDEYKDVKDAFIDMIVSFSEKFGVSEEEKEASKKEVEYYFNFILDDSLFSKDNNYYDLSRMLYLTGKGNQNTNVSEYHIYKNTHDKVVEVLGNIVKVGFINDVRDNDIRVEFLKDLLLKKDKVEETELASYISQNTENRRYDYNKDVQVYEELLDLFIGYLDENDTSKIEELDVYGTRYNVSQDRNFIKYKDIIDFYKNIRSNKNVNDELKSKLRRLVAELFLAANMMFAIRKTTTTIHGLLDWDTPYNAFRPMALELMTYAILKNINELLGPTKTEQKGEETTGQTEGEQADSKQEIQTESEQINKKLINKELNKYTGKIDELLNKLGSINRKLVESANISTDIRGKKVTAKTNKDSIEVDFTDFSKPENKVSVGGVYDDYMFNFYGTLIIKPLSPSEISNMDKRDITNIYLFRQQMRRLLDNIYSSLLENVASLRDLEKYVDEGLIDGDMTTSFEYNRTGLLNDDKLTYYDKAGYVKGASEPLSKFISTAKRIQMMGILYNHRFTIFNETIKVLTLLDFKQSSDLRRFADIGVMYNKDFYNFVFSKYIDVLLNSENAYMLNVNILDKLIKENKAEKQKEDFDLNVKSENIEVKVVNQENKNIEEQEKPC